MPKRAGSVEIELSPEEATAIKDTLDKHSMVAMTDLKGRITYVNEAFCRASKYRRDELIGKTHTAVKSGFHTRAFYDHLWHTIESGRVWQGDVRDRAKDGTYFWTRSAIMPKRNKDGDVCGYIIIRTPISDLMRQIEKQIRQGVETDEIRRLRDG